MSHVHGDRERLMDLLSDRAVAGGLPPAEDHEADDLLRRFPDVDSESFDLAAAAIDLLFESPTPEPLPAGLRDRLVSDARRWHETARPAPPAPVAVVRPLVGSWLPWLAAAACLAFALVTWLPARPATPSEQYARLVDGAPDALRIAWTATADPAAGGVPAVDPGDVVWSRQWQQGFMRFRGVEVNDPSAVQYQLWIFDRIQPEATPINGGVFDVTESGDVIVEIHPGLEVVDPYLFAITVEKPGGVVVSKRERIILTAAVEGA
ncbi:MAG: anti-sigma factor [Planctomycetota bacterium]|jgi:hypothetical protein